MLRYVWVKYASFTRYRLRCTFFILFLLSLKRWTSERENRYLYIYIYNYVRKRFKEILALTSHFNRRLREMHFNLIFYFLPLLLLYILLRKFPRSFRWKSTTTTTTTTIGLQVMYVEYFTRRKRRRKFALPFPFIISFFFYYLLFVRTSY